MLNDKDIKILNSLKPFTEAINIKDLATINNLSTRSIRNYIDKINENFSFDCITIDKGFCKVVDPILVSNFLENYNLNSYSSNIIGQYMLYTISFKGKINLTHIANEFNISRTSVKNYLTNIKVQLSKYHLKLEQADRSGLSLFGVEPDVRKLLINLLSKYSNLTKVEQKVIFPIVSDYLDNLYESTLNILLNQLEKILKINFSDYTYKT